MNQNRPGEPLQKLDLADLELKISEVETSAALSIQRGLSLIHTICFNKGAEYRTFVKKDKKHYLYVATPDLAASMEVAITVESVIEVARWIARR